MNGPARIVYVFWNSSVDLEESAERYCECVRTAPAVQDGCETQSKLVDVVSNPQEAQHHSGSTIEVVAVKDGNTIGSLENPSFGCDEIHQLVARLCR